MDNPLEIVISPSLHPIKAFRVANHGIPKIIGCPLEGSFDSMTIKSTRYSHEAIDTTMSSRTPTSFTVVRSASSRMEGVGRRNCPNCKNYKTAVVIILMADPKSINVLSMAVLFIITVTTGAPGFVYLQSRTDLSYIHTFLL